MSPDPAPDPDAPWRRPSTLHLPQGPWRTVLECLCSHFAAIPGEEWRSRMARGLVQDARGRPFSTDAPYRRGLLVRYFREVGPEVRIPVTESILHEDADLLVADKPHFLPVTPTGPWVEETLLARLVRRTGNRALAPLHRLDRGTAGLVLFSASAASRARYQALFRDRRIVKTYEALAAALTSLEFPLVRRSRLVPGEPFFRMCEQAGAPNSETRIEMIERGPGRWRYRLQPVTGRTHQLRVHMAALGAPILNDPYYPALSPARADDYDRPLALIATTLEFTDPLTGVQRRFTSTRTLGT